MAKFNLGYLVAGRLEKVEMLVNEKEEKAKQKGED